MSTIKKSLSLTVIAAIAVMAFGASSAFATDAAVCQFDGLAGALVPPLPSAQRDNAEGGLQDHEFGTYTFSGGATCVKVDTDTGDAANSGVYTVSIAARGDYDNQVCGTGGATGTTEVSSLAPGWEGIAPNGDVTASYSINFIVGQGTLSVSNVANAERSGGTGSGYVNITPTAGGNCATTDVEFFEVTGAFQANG